MTHTNTYAAGAVPADALRLVGPCLIPGDGREGAVESPVERFGQRSHVI